MAGQIKKAKIERDFAIIPNAIVNDNRLSLKAIGLLCYLLSLPDDWQIYKTRLHLKLKDGRDAVLAAFSELSKSGYIETVQIKESGKFVGYDYTVHSTPDQIYVEEKPITENPESVEKLSPITGNPETVFPITENPSPQIINLTKETIQNFNSSKEELFDLNNSKKTTSSGSSKKKKAQDPEDSSGAKKQTFHDRCKDIYYYWHEDKEGFPPKLDGTQINALKMSYKYLQTIVNKRALKDGIVLDDESREEKIVEAWALILANWQNLKTYEQGKTRLTDINTNLQIILKQIKDAHKTSADRSKSTEQAQSVMQILADRKNNKR